MSEFCVIGSGISGATIANLLNKKNTVILFDKARGPGGRASFKRIRGNIGFDHGTQYFSPKTPEFKKFTKDLIKKRILINKDIFFADEKSVYMYSRGWNLKALYSIMIGTIFAFSTIWNPNLNIFQSFSWIIGFAVSSIVYYLLASEK